MALREKENIHRPDMIQLLMQAKKGSLVSTNEDKDDISNAGFATAPESATKIDTIKTGQITTVAIFLEVKFTKCFCFFSLDP